MNPNHYAVIMAGGIGSRFWPVSTEKFPKQFHDLLGTGQSLLQKTFSRLQKIIPSENILILINKHYESLVLEQLPAIQKSQLVLEPVMRNTAPCILLSALKIKKQNPRAVMLVAPSDHWIEDETNFEQDLRVAFDYCSRHDSLMTLGITPTFPNTGYGYIQYDTTSDTPVKAVKRFTEKPAYEQAKAFLEQGNYLWNAGIFVWSVQSITTGFEQHLPLMYDLFHQGMNLLNSPQEASFLDANYSKAENISIDYGILEKTKKTHTLLASFDWSDLGSWGSLYEKLPKDNQANAVIQAKTLLKNAHGNIIRTDAGKRVVISQLSDYIIVDKGNTLVILPKSEEQSIKQLREEAFRL